jgi:predicted nucleotide-binding protein (sugar kinase/HSP70/actin superfamily)
MKITFPHLGNAYIGFKSFFEFFGRETVVPPPITKKTVELGSKGSPEFACLPLKICIGNFIEAIELGADSIIMAGGCGPCRFGYYCVLEEEILKDMGYDVKMHIVDPPTPLRFKRLLDQLKEATGAKNYRHLLQGMIAVAKVVKKVDQVEKLTFYTRPREITAGETDRIYQRFHRRVRQSYGPEEVLKIADEIIEQLNTIPLKADFHPLRVSLIGEIYTLIEPYTNLNIEQKLGRLGVEVERSLNISDWLKTHVVLELFHIKGERNVYRNAYPFMKNFVGGHGINTVGDAVYYHKKGFDGMIQILPLTCMPEIVAQSILPKVEEKYGTPIMTMVTDELSGDAGYNTRLEAFVDLLSRKKEMKENRYERILFRC